VWICIAPSREHTSDKELRYILEADLIPSLKSHRETLRQKILLFLWCHRVLCNSGDTPPYLSCQLYGHVVSRLQSGDDIVLRILMGPMGPLGFPWEWESLG